MTSGPPDRSRQPQPGQRALGAIGTAVQRARASQGTPTALIGPDTPPGGSPVAGSSNQALAPRFNDNGAHGGSERWLAAAVVVVAVLVVASGIALAVSTSRGSGKSSPIAASNAPEGRTRSLPATKGAERGTTTTTIVSTPGGPPQISSLTPASGSAGQTVTVHGSNFISSDGSIVASFDGQVTATSCPSEDLCTLTVPPSSAGETSAQVTITTASGTSNAITFSYG
jgi:hypothetical protein